MVKGRSRPAVRDGVEDRGERRLGCPFGVRNGLETPAEVTVDPKKVRLIERIEDVAIGAPKLCQELTVRSALEEGTGGAGLRHRLFIATARLEARSRASAPKEVSPAKGDGRGVARGPLCFAFIAPSACQGVTQH